MPDVRELSPYHRLPDPPAADTWSRVGGAEEPEVHLRDYWRVLAKHRRFVAGVFFTVVATTALVTFTMAPQFTAATTLQIERQAPNLAPVQEVQQIDGDLPYDKYDYYQTQYEILASRTVAARVIRALGLAEDERFVPRTSGGLLSIAAGAFRSFLPASAPIPTAEELGVDPRLINRYLGMLEIEPVRNSRLVKVSFTSAHRDLSAEVANRHAEEYTNASLEQRLGMTLKAKQFLEQELAKARDRVVAAEASLNQFRKDRNIVSLDGGPTDVVSERLADLNGRHTEAQADRIRLEGQYRLVRQRDFESLPDVVSSGLVAQLKGEIAKIEAERAELGKKFKPGYPKMREAMAREAEAKSRLDAEIRKIAASIESAYLAAKNREESLAAELEKQRQAALVQKDSTADYDTLKRDVDTARDLYANLLQRLKDIDVAEEIRVSNVSVVDAAAPPVRPSQPRKLLNLVLACALGLMLGVGLAFFREYLDDTVKTPEDVERRLRLPTLGVVPSFGSRALAYGAGGSRPAGFRPHRRQRAEGNGSTELVVVSQPQSVISEAYRTIRTGILLSSADAPPQLILVTSGTAGEGKTVTAVNQAMTLVQSGARVLLLDADIRKPRVHTIFDVPNGHGLSTYLAGQSSFEQVVHEICHDGNGKGHRNGGGESASPDGALFVLPSGPLPPNPAELLGSVRMRETLEGMREHFDYVVVDTPPILPVTDTVLLSTMVDGVVLVVRGQETPTAIVKKSRDRLAYARAKILGVVLNDVDVTSGDYGAYQHYYSYYSSDGAAPAADEARGS